METLLVAAAEYSFLYLLLGGGFFGAIVILLRCQDAGAVGAEAAG